MSSPEEHDDEFAEPTIEELQAPVSTGIKPEVAAALAALRPARPSSEPSLPAPSVPPAPSSSSSFSTPRPRPTTSPSMPPPRAPSKTFPSPTKPAHAGWSPPRVNIKPILWGAFVVFAVVVCVAMLRARPAPAAAVEAGTTTMVFDTEALACTRVTTRGQRVECAFTPQQLGRIAEAERRSRLDATRRQAGAAGFTGVVLVDEGRVWRVLHAEAARRPTSRSPPR